LQRFFQQIVKRKVLPVAAAYAIGVWVLLQVGDVVIGLLELPGWTGKIVVAVALIGLPVALVLSWIYDWTPQGVVVTGKLANAEDETAIRADSTPIDLDTLALATPQLPRLIGRHDECAILSESLEAARNGSGSIVLIGGEPGVGKSRLGEEALAIGRSMNMLPLAGHAYENRGAPFITSVEILEEIMQVLPAGTLRNTLGSTAPEIARLLPELRRVFADIPDPAELPPDQQQRFLFNAVLEFLGRLSQKCPVVMLLDDLHWADESSILLLQHLVPHLQRMSILMVATFRDVEADMGEPFRRALASLTREPFVKRVSLRRFSRSDVESLLQAASSNKPPESIVDTIFDETSGNAFFVQSVYQHLTEEGQRFDEQGAWLTDFDPDSLAVPDSVRLVTGLRIARLNQRTQDMLRVAAVMGLRFRLPLLEATSEQPDLFIESIEEAENAQLIKRSSGGRELRYEFVHALARQTVLSTLSAPRQQKLHLTIADAIETVYAAVLESHAADLAFHLAEAGSDAEPERVVCWLQLAGEKALATVAMEEAAELFDKALSIIGDAETETRGDLLHLRATALLSLGRQDAVQEDMLAAFTAYRNLGLENKAGQVASELAYVFIWNAQPDKAHDLARRGLDLATNEDSAAHCNLLSARGLAHSMGSRPGDPAAGQSLHQAAVDISRRLENPNLLADMLSNQGLDCWVRLDAKARAIAQEARAILRGSGQDWKLGQCLWIEKAGLVFVGKFEDAARIDAELLPLAQRIGDYGSLGCSWLLTSTIEQARGDLHASSQALRLSAEAFAAGGFPWGEFNPGYEAINLLLEGRDEEARVAVDTVGTKPLLGTVWSGAQQGYWLSGKAHLGDADILERFRAHASYLPSTGTAMAAGAVIFLKGSIEALLLAGEKEEAARLYPLIAEVLQQGPGKFEFAFGVHDRFAGMAAAAAEDWDNADRHYRDSLELVDTLPHRVDQARVSYWYARMLVDRARPADTERRNKLVGRARKLSSEMGMHGLARQIDALE
jgi:hypothetical protein